MANVRIKAPTTVFYNGQYCAPGTEVEIDERDAARLIGEHGEYGGPPKLDPGNTQTLNVLDEASIAELNKQASINKGHGDMPLPPDDELNAMKKGDLVKLAADRKVALDPADTKEEIIAKLKA